MQHQALRGKNEFLEGRMRGGKQWREGKAGTLRGGERDMEGGRREGRIKKGKGSNKERGKGRRRNQERGEEREVEVRNGERGGGRKNGEGGKGGLSI